MKHVSCTDEAKRLLSECFGLSPAHAEDVLRTWAMRVSTSPAHIAEVLIRQIWQGDELPQDRALARTIERYLRDLPNVSAPPEERALSVEAEDPVGK